MSGNLAHARPLPSPVREQHPRHIEVVATRAQRKARPKVAYAVVTVASLFVIFAAQLLLSIVVSDGAYQISTLQDQQKELIRTEQSLMQNLDLLGSTQNLAANAAKLGMVPGTSPLLLDVSTGAVTSGPVAVGAGCATCAPANSLLAGVPLVDPSKTPTTQAPATTTTVQDPAIGATIPAPVTH